VNVAKNGRSNIVFTEATVLKTTEAAASVASNVATALLSHVNMVWWSMEADCIGSVVEPVTPDEPQCTDCMRFTWAPAVQPAWRCSSPVGIP